MALPSSTFNDLIESLASHYGLDLTNEDERRYLLRDVLTDCRHYADRHEINFPDALDGAYQVYLDEID